MGFKGFRVWIEVEEVDEDNHYQEKVVSRVVDQSCGRGFKDCDGAMAFVAELERSVELLAEMTRAVEVFCQAVDMIQQGVHHIDPAALQKSTYIVGLRDVLAKVKGGGKNESGS